MNRTKFIIRYYTALVKIGLILANNKRKEIKRWEKNNPPSLYKKETKKTIEEIKMMER